MGQGGGTSVVKGTLEARGRSGWDIFRLGEAPHQGLRQLGHPSETPTQRASKCTQSPWTPQGLPFWVVPFTAVGIWYPGSLICLFYCWNLR